jgi:hypothetical protein
MEVEFLLEFGINVLFTLSILLNSRAQQLDFHWLEEPAEQVRENAMQQRPPQEK